MKEQMPNSLRSPEGTGHFYTLLLMIKCMILGHEGFLVLRVKDFKSTANVMRCGYPISHTLVLIRILLRQEIFFHSNLHLVFVDNMYQQISKDENK